jgi:hypothetical protein
MGSGLGSCPRTPRRGRAAVTEFKKIFTDEELEYLARTVDERRAAYTRKLHEDPEYKRIMREFAEYARQQRALRKKTE